MKLLVADDDKDLLALIAFTLSQAGYLVVKASDGPSAIRAFEAEAPDLVILDINMPGASGFQVCETIRSKSRAPVMMLTVRGEEEDLVRALDLGADDYLTKPFSTRELVARIRAVLRRTSPAAGEQPLVAEGLQLDPVSQRVSADDQPLAMGPTEYRLLAFFMSHPERAYTRVQLLDQVWGANVFVEDRTIDVHIRRLRKALEPWGYDRFIQTVRGTGYRFSTRVTER